MEVELFSNSLELFQGTIENESLMDSLNHLAEVNGNAVRILSWDKSRIAVPLTILVDIPPLGTDQGIDIREDEPIILVFSLTQYPNTAPLVFTDRPDFPKDRLAHLYIAKNGRPPAFCYVRGNRDDWYGQKRVQDLVIRISNWLRDAATGALTQDGNQFEPLRLEGYEGVLIYDYDQIANIVQEDLTLLVGAHLAVGLFEMRSESGLSLTRMLTVENLNEIDDLLSKDKIKSDADSNRKRYRFGYFLWATATDVFDSYNIDIPANWREFKEFCNHYKISFEYFEEFYSKVDNSAYVIFPVIVAIKRPKQVIGFGSDLEFVNFRFSIDASDVIDGKILDTADVKLTSHNQPLTIAKARTISGLPEISDFSAMVFGCGALGSKVTMHLVRSGITRLTLIDPDNISPHNMVRHALLPEYDGQNKASAIADIVVRLYPGESSQIEHLPLPNLPFGLNGALFEGVDWLFDFTASESFFIRVVTTEVLNKTKVLSSYITNFGDLGILFREGIGRNPRIDDLRIALYAHYKLPEVSAWLARERDAAGQTNLTVSVGVGCNSETTILSDEKISLHAAIFAGTIKVELASANESNGKILLSVIQESDHFGVKTIPLVVRPLDVIPAINDPSWSVRFTHGVIGKIIAETKRGGRDETGGVFTGMVNYKTKTIHVTGLIPAPSDSKANPVCFFRGHQGLPDQVNAIEMSSGGQLGYVGEWHSHPCGPNGPSQTDMASVEKFKKEFNSLVTPLPVFLTIVTKNNVLPFVF